MATHFGILGWRIPWTEEPGMLQLWCCKELNTTVGLSMHTHMYTHTWSDKKMIHIERAGAEGRERPVWVWPLPLFARGLQAGLRLRPPKKKKKKVIYIGMNKMKYKSWKNYMANMNCYGVDILERALIRDVPEKVDRISIDGVNEEAGLK